MCMCGFILRHIYFVMTLRGVGFGCLSLCLCRCFGDWDLVVIRRTGGGVGGEFGGIVCDGIVGRRGGQVVLHFEHLQVVSDRHT